MIFLCQGDASTRNPSGGLRGGSGINARKARIARSRRKIISIRRKRVEDLAGMGKLETLLGGGNRKLEGSVKKVQASRLKLIN